MTTSGHALRWDAGSARWWWSDPDAAAVHAWSAERNATLTCRLPDGAGLLAHCRSGRLLLGLPKRLCVADTPPVGRLTQHLRMRPLTAVDAAEPRTGISDGRVDRRGFLVFGTANLGEDRRPIGSFYQYSRQRGLRRLALPAVAQASSICFSVDGKRMYFADAWRGQILCCDYDAEQARIGAIRVFASLETNGVPRGAIVDSADSLWSAQAGRLVQYDEQGRELGRIVLDCRTPAFGGAQLTQLMATGADGLVEVPGTFARGQPEILFDDQELT